MKKLFGAFVFLTVLFLILSSNTYANYGQYGGETPSYGILIDKMVAKPDTDQYVDNLSVSDPRFSPSQDVWFKVRVKNTSNKNLTNVEVRDYIPSHLEPLEGPGTWNSDTRIITWNAGDFNVDEEKTYFLKMRVLSANNLPADKGLFCVVNRADARNENTYDDDTSQLCIEKKVQGVTTVPSAGPELGLGLVAVEILGLSTGIYLKRKK